MNKEKSTYNSLGFILFVATLVFSSAWGSYFLLIENKIDLGEYADQMQEPQETEGLSSEEQENPWLSSQALVSYGSKIYKAQCALCHGAGGLGDGTPGLIPPPRNLVEGKWQHGGSSKDLFTTLNKGIEGTSMVSFKHLSKLDRWALVHYVRSITNNKVADNAEELEEFAKQAL
ncbi:MAG: cytochrome c [Bdellovibrionaceae bacterium]|nr:cytochrome c [Pseudobdellovibrionaceae bacterium]